MRYKYVESAVEMFMKLFLFYIMLTVRRHSSATTQLASTFCMYYFGRISRSQNLLVTIYLRYRLENLQ